MHNPIIRTLDIETAPNLADVWGIWQQNIGMTQIRERGYIMSFAYTDTDSDDVFYDDCRNDADDSRLVEGIIETLDEADIIVGHNIKKFDLRWVNGKALAYGIQPPSPYKVVDTLLEARKIMYLLSYRLEDVATELGCTPKSKHPKFPGHKLWSECLAGNKKAWDEMVDYNVQDVETTEEVYLKLRPYIKNHPNLGVYAESDRTVCGACMSDKIHYRGYFPTNTGLYRKYQCQDCGHWGSHRHTEYPADKRKVLGKNVG